MVVRGTRLSKLVAQEVPVGFLQQWPCHSLPLLSCPALPRLSSPPACPPLWWALWDFGCGDTAFHVRGSWRMSVTASREPGWTGSKIMQEERWEAWPYRTQTLMCTLRTHTSSVSPLLQHTPAANGIFRSNLASLNGPSNICFHRKRLSQGCSYRFHLCYFSRWSQVAFDYIHLLLGFII